MKKKILVLVMFLFCLVGLVACGDVEAPAGEKGDTGAQGKSAYDLAVEAGFQGTVTEWLASLQGEQGQKGRTGVQGESGISGVNAQELFVFVEDGGVYWCYVDKDGNQVGDAHLLWYYLDYIMITYSKKDFDTVDDLRAGFLADMSKVAGKEITAENFQDEFGDNGAFMGGGGSLPCTGVMADYPALWAKYKFMIQWIYDTAFTVPSFLEADSSYKYELGTLDGFGIDTSAFTALGYDSRSYNANHGNKNITGNVVNFLTNGNGGEGTSDYYPVCDFTGVDCSGITASGTPLFEPEKVLRSKVSSYKLKTIEKNDPLMGEGYKLAGWTDKDGNVVTSISNHSQELFIKTEFEGIFVTLKQNNAHPDYGFDGETLTNVNVDNVPASIPHDGYVWLGWYENGAAVKPANMKDGHTYQATWRANNTIDLDGGWSVNGLGKDFVADVSAAWVAADESHEPITPENFYETLGRALFLADIGFANADLEAAGEDSADGSADGLVKQGGLLADETFAAKWGWYISFIASKVDNKYAGTAFALMGFTPATESRVTTYPEEACHLLVATIDNAINATNNVRNEYNPAKGFDTVAKFEGIEALVKTNVPVLTENMLGNLTYTGVENFVLFKEGCAFAGYYTGEEDPVALSEVEEGATYKPFWAVEVGLDFNGGYICDKDAVGAAFLADISEAAGRTITADSFYEELVGNFLNVTAVDAGVYSKDGICVDHPELITKWGWLLEFVGSVMGDRKYGNTALVAYGLHSAKDSNVVTSSLDYASKTLTLSVANFLLGSNGFKPGTTEQIHGGSSSGAVSADFSSPSAYNGLIELAVEHDVKQVSAVLFAKDAEALIAKVEYPDHKLVGVVDKDGTPVEPEDMLDPEAGYKLDWEACVTINLDGGYEYSSDIIGAAFLADVSEACGKTITAANFYSTFNNEDAPFMGVGKYDVDHYPTFGLCADHPELVTKWGWLIEFIAGRKADSYWNATLIAYGLNYTAGDTPKTEPGKHANRYLIMNIDGFLNHNLNTAGGSSHGAVSFADPSAYDGLEALLAEKMPTFFEGAPSTIKFFVSEQTSVVARKPGCTFVQFEEVGVEGVPVESFEAGKSYIAIWQPVEE